MDHSTLPLFSLQPETREIPLTQGKVAIVDAADYDFLMQWKWRAVRRGRTWYARRTGTPSVAAHSTVFMHRDIVKALPGESLDHINGNGLDNRRSNLRVATCAQNQHNSRIRKDNTSGYKGVGWDKKAGAWQARIKKDGRSVRLGYFDDVVEAARAYDRAALELYGEFARPNF